MSNEYGKKYPGSGGATNRPPSGGEPWRELPEGTFTRAPITETVIEEYRPGFFGRLIGRETTYTETEQVVGYTTRKNYR